MYDIISVIMSDIIYDIVLELYHVLLCQGDIVYDMMYDIIYAMNAIYL